MLLLLLLLCVCVVPNPPKNRGLFEAEYAEAMSYEGHD